MSDSLRSELDRLEKTGLRRALKDFDTPPARLMTCGGRTFLNFSSNDYLGLANSPTLKTAAIRTIEKFGSGAGASRLLSGNLGPHRDLEDALADWKQTEAALVFSSGYATALGTLPALFGPGDTIILDKLCHACLVDAARLSGARLRIFPHQNLDRLEALLAAERKRAPGCRLLVATESVFSMDGDLTPLRELVALKERHDAWLLVDEAHAIGIFGPDGSGLLRQEGLNDAVELQMGTLSKALGSAGGYLAGSRILIDFLVNKARSFIFSTAPTAASAAAATAAIELLRKPEGRRRMERLHHTIRRAGKILYPFLDGAKPESPIFPILVGDAETATTLSENLWEDGCYVPAIRFPTVPRNGARLRLSWSAFHQGKDVDTLAEALRSRWPSIGTT